MRLHLLEFAAAADDDIGLNVQAVVSTSITSVRAGLVSDADYACAGPQLPAMD